MKKLLFLCVMMMVPALSWGQNAIIGSGFAGGWTTPGNNEYFGAAPLGSGRIFTDVANGTGNQYFRFVAAWNSDDNTQYGPSSDSDIEITFGSKVTAIHSTTTGAWFTNVTSISDNYVFKTAAVGVPPKPLEFVVFHVQGDVQTISAHTSPGTITSGTVASLSITTSGTSTGQGFYVVYSDDDFSSSTILEMTGIGTSYSAEIPSEFNTTGKTVKYYFISSGSGLSIISADINLFAINVLNNTGSNYSYVTVDPAPASAPTLTTLADNETGTSIYPTFTWETVTYATDYRIQIDDNSDFSSPVVNATTSNALTYAVTSALTANTTYYWQVRAENAKGESNYSTYRTFTTGDGTFTVYYNNHLNWASGPRVYYWKSSNTSDNNAWAGQAMTAPIGGSPWYSIEIPEGYDRVIFNDAGVGNPTTEGVNKTAELTRSSTGYFNGTSWSDTDPNVLSTGPSLTTPADEATDLAITTNFEWAALANTTTYTIEIDDNSDFSSTIVSETATSPYDPASNLSYNTTYYWRVKGTNYVGDSDWSSRSFTTIAIAVPTVSSPSDNATDVAIAPTLSWSTSNYSGDYRIQIDNNSDFSSPEVNTTTSNTSYTPDPALNYYTTYYWRVRSEDGSETSDYSTSRTFTTLYDPSAVPANAPVLSSPANAATGVSSLASFSWTTVVAATTYDIQISTASDFSSIALESLAQGGVSYSVPAGSGLLPNTVYYWRVRANNVNGSTSYTQRSFTTVGTFTVYFINPSGWDAANVKIYPYLAGTPDKEYRTWSGETMTTPTGGSIWYTYEVPLTYNTIIFSNNGATQIDAGTRNTTGYYYNGSWSNSDPTLSPITSAANGNWNDAATWTGNIVPATNQPVVIDHDVTLNVNVNVADLTINSGKSLDAGSYTITLANASTFTNNGTFTAGTSTVSFLGSGSVTGSTETTFNNVTLAGGVALGASTTINGILLINTGGYLAQTLGGNGLAASTAVPNYGSSSTLAYSGTFSYGENDNYAGGYGTTEGKIPHNLTVSGSGSLTIAFNARTLDGILTIEPGASLTTNGLLTLQSGAMVSVEGTLTGDVTIEQEIGGAQGWRTLAAPVSSTDFADITGGLWTQGFTGASTTEGSANVRTWNGSAYVAPSNITDAVAAGTGYAMLVFADDDFDGNAEGFPKTMSVTGALVNSDVEVTVNQGNEVFTLAGNPFLSTIDSDNLTASSLYSTVYVYDQSGGEFIAWNGSAGSLANGLIAPFQGFFVASNAASGASLTIPTSAKTTGGELQKETAKTPVIAFTSTLGELSNSTYLSFTEVGTEGKDISDAFKMYPLDTKAYLSLSTYNGASYLDINNLPAELSNQLEIPLFVSAYSPENGVWNALTGEATLTWAELANMPEAWVVELVDNETGETVNMREVTEYNFMLSAPLAKQRAVDQELTPRVYSAEGTSRFTVKVGPMTTSIEGTELPTEVTLNQNYPNPFNPSTQISFALPQAMNVSVKVYDMLGREVATLFSGAASAGTTNVQFNASNMSSGMYYYRLQAGESSITKKMMLVK